MKRWLAMFTCALPGCHAYDLVQPESVPITVSISVVARHDARTVAGASIFIDPGIDETGDFRRVPIEPSVVDGSTLQAHVAPGGRFVSYGKVDTTALMLAPRMVSFSVPVLSTARISPTVLVPIVVGADSGRVTLRGTDDLRLRLSYPAGMVQSDYEFGSWNLSLRTVACNSGVRVLDLGGSGLAPAELRIPRDLIATGGAGSLVACLRLFLARSERMETMSLFVSSSADVTWSVTVEP